MLLTILSALTVQDDVRYINVASVDEIHRETRRISPQEAIFIGSDRSYVTVELSFDPQAPSQSLLGNWYRENKSQHIEAVKSSSLVGRPYELSSQTNKAPSYFQEERKKGLGYSSIAEELRIDNGSIVQSSKGPTKFFVEDLHDLAGVDLKICPFLEPMWVSVSLAEPMPVKEFLENVCMASYGKLVSHEDGTFTLDVDVSACRQLWKRSLSVMYGSESETFGTHLRLKLLDAVPDSNMYGFLWEKRESYKSFPMNPGLSTESKEYIRKYITDRDSNPNNVLSDDWHENLDWDAVWKFKLGTFPFVHIAVPMKGNHKMLYIY